jgi:hypothetical protein
MGRFRFESFLLLFSLFPPRSLMRQGRTQAHESGKGLAAFFHLYDLQMGATITGSRSQGTLAATAS